MDRVKQRPKTQLMLGPDSGSASGSRNPQPRRAPVFGDWVNLPSPFGRGTVPAQVVWCTVIGRKRKLGGESHLVARSGLRFSALTAPQHAALTDTLYDLTTALQPIA